MQSLNKISKILKVLSFKQRLRIVKELLERGEYMCYCELTDVIDKDMSVIYRHFKKLERVGILETKKNGKRLEGKVKNPEKIKKLLEIVEEVSNNEN